MGAKRFGYLHRPAYRDRKTGRKKLSPYYYLRYKWKGQWHGIATRTSDPQDAEKVRWKVFAELFAGRLPWITQEGPTLADVLELVERHYDLQRRRSADRLSRSLKHVRAFAPFRDLVAAKLTEDLWEQYQVARRKEGAANATINRERAALVLGYRIAARRRDADGKPLVDRIPDLPRLQEAAPRERYLEPQEFEAIRRELLSTRQPPSVEHPDEANAMLADLATIYNLTGWRKREPMSLRWDSSVNWFRRTITLDRASSKSGEPWEISFAEMPDLEALLRRRRKHADDVERRGRQPCLWVFHREGRQVRDFYGAWRAACRRAGIDPAGARAARIHDFRRTVARDLFDAGADVKTVCDVIGWKGPAMAYRYRIVSGRDRAKALGRLQDLRREQADAQQLTLSLEAARAKRRGEG